MADSARLVFRDESGVSRFAAQRPVLGEAEVIPRPNVIEIRINVWCLTSQTHCDSRLGRLALLLLSAEVELPPDSISQESKRIIDVVAAAEYADGMTARDDFLTWVKTTLYQAELALHNGDAGPRRAIWSRNEPVSILGAWRNANGQHEVEDVLNFLEASFSECTSYEFELVVFDVVGDMAFTAGLEHSSVSVDGKPRTYTLRATQVYRREGGEWRVAHRHADTVSE